MKILLNDVELVCDDDEDSVKNSSGSGKIITTNQSNDRLKQKYPGCVSGMALLGLMLTSMVLGGIARSFHTQRYIKNSAVSESSARTEILASSTEFENRDQMVSVGSDVVNHLSDSEDEINSQGSHEKNKPNRRKLSNELINRIHF